MTRRKRRKDWEPTVPLASGGPTRVMQTRTRTRRLEHLTQLQREHLLFLARQHGVERDVAEFEPPFCDEVRSIVAEANRPGIQAVHGTSHAFLYHRHFYHLLASPCGPVTTISASAPVVLVGRIGPYAGAVFQVKGPDFQKAAQRFAGHCNVLCSILDRQLDRGDYYHESDLLAIELKPSPQLFNEVCYWFSHNAPQVFRPAAHMFPRRGEENGNRVYCNSDLKRFVERPTAITLDQKALAGPQRGPRLVDAAAPDTYYVLPFQR